MPTPNFKRTKFACFFAYLAMSSVFSLPPLLFLTFREMYGISYTLLGTLVLINFTTQLSVDLIFTFFSKHFNVKYVVRVMPLITSAGLLTYAIVPTLFPQYAYVGLVVGTFIFSIAAGLSEVLLSPVIAAIPSPDPDREMSKLHSAYAWGVGPVVLLSTLFLHIFGRSVWHALPLLFLVIPLTAFALLIGAEFPNMENHGAVQERTPLRNKTLWLCVAAIFLGGAAENTMSQWGSGYLEAALGIPKVWGDVFGVALFSLMFG